VAKFEELTDNRGSITKCQINGVQVNMLFTKKGSMRGGDIHPVKQYDVILSGTFKITLRDTSTKSNPKDIVITKNANDFITIPPDVPHLFKSVTDTTMIEWWEGGRFPAGTKYYEPYRRLVKV